MDSDLTSIQAPQQISALEAKELRGEVKRLSRQFWEERARHEELLELREGLDVDFFHAKLAQLRGRVVALQEQLGVVVHKLALYVEGDCPQVDMGDSSGPVSEGQQTPTRESISKEEAEPEGDSEQSSEQSSVFDSTRTSISSNPPSPAEELTSTAQEGVEESALAAQSEAISEEQRRLGEERAALEATLADLSKRVADTDQQEAQSRAQHDLAIAQLEVVARKERLLEEQEGHLARKHAQLAEDLAERQHALNREWAGLDMAQRGKGGLAEDLEAEREVMQAEWAAIEEEWNALEERKAQMERDSLVELKTEDSLGLFGGWREALDEQLADIAEEQEASSADRGRLSSLASDVERTALPPVEAEEEKPSSMQGGDLESAETEISREPATPPLGNRAPILKRGDSPRELDKWAMVGQGVKEEVHQEASKAPETPLTPAALTPTQPDVVCPSDGSCEEDISGELPGPGLLDSAASIFGTSSSLNQDLYGRAGQLREERTKLWTSVADPEEMDKRLRRLERMEAEHAQREMRLQCREAVDNRQQAEMVLARSLALDQREKALAQREAALSEAASRAFSRDAEVQKLRSKIRSLESQQYARRRSMERRSTDLGIWRFANRKSASRRRTSVSRDSTCAPRRSISMPLGNMNEEGAAASVQA